MDLILSIISIVLFIVAVVKFATRKKRDVPIKIPVILLVVAISLFIISTEMSHRKVLESELEEIEQNVDDDEEIIEDDKVDENESEKEMDKKAEVEDSIVGSIGEGEKIIDIVIEGQDIFIKVDLGEKGILSMKDLAISRYSSISEKLLEDDYWNDIEVEFENVGIVKMNSKQAKSNEFGKYFEAIEIENNFKSKNNE